ncbi:MAG TPA: hypothetical protein DDX25_05605 [Firmicutes bacterium]|jgi:hypothetical protein|nr:hypothetical protein [Bacillota bacterium]
MSAWVGVFAKLFFLQFVQTFGALRLLGRAAPGWRIAAFAGLQSLSILFLRHTFPLLELSFLLMSVTHLACFIWVFEVDLFPDALFAYLTPLSLYALGNCVFPPLFAHYFPQLLEGSWSAKLLGPSGEYTAFLPSLMLTSFFLVAPKPGDTRQEAHTHASSLGFGWAIILLSIAVSCHETIAVLKSAANPGRTYLLLLGIRLVVLPVLIVMVYQYSQKERKSEKVLQYHLKRSTVQEAALRTLREERHDLLNELTLISTYVQMGKAEEALLSIAYSAAKLSDRHNYPTLPADAWETILQVKQAEAQRLGVDFAVNLQAEPPSDFHEQRLLPKVMMNLVDNAFAAVAYQDKGVVRLTWSADDQGRRLLKVSNNGPEINSLDGKRIFRAGVTSKKDPSGNHGWGLVICKHIAEELGGTIAFTSSPDLTTFTLTLPPASARKQEARSAT